MQAWSCDQRFSQSQLGEGYAGLTTEIVDSVPLIRKPTLGFFSI